MITDDELDAMLAACYVDSIPNLIAQAKLANRLTVELLALRAERSESLELLRESRKFVISAVEANVTIPGFDPNTHRLAIRLAEGIRRSEATTC